MKVPKISFTKLTDALKSIKGVPIPTDFINFNVLKNKFLALSLIIFIGISFGVISLFQLGEHTAVEKYNFAPPLVETFITIADEYESVLAPKNEEIKTDGSVFRSAFNTKNKQPKISLIITDLGISDKTTENAIFDLPYQVALAFSPYSKKLSFWIEQSHIEQHETLLALPMEPKQYPLYDPGPKALLTRSSTEENKESLKHLLARRYGSVGFINHMGDRFLSDRKKLLPIFRDIAKTDAFFIAQKPGIKSRATETALQASLKFKQTDLIIDDIAAQNYITNQLLQLEKLATTRGFAVGVAGNHPVTFKTISKWARTLKRKGITLSPISAVMEISNDTN